VRSAGGERAQAAIELVAAALIIAITGLAVFQLLAAGQAAAVADGAAEAAAIALANGRDPEAAARHAAPGWPRDAVRVRTRGDRVTVELAAPAALRALRGRLHVTSAATARAPR
jgi:hypothetical protein